jgi:hypothetical protein
MFPVLAKGLYFVFPTKQTKKSIDGATDLSDTKKNSS